MGCSSTYFGHIECRPIPHDGMVAYTGFNLESGLGTSESQKMGRKRDGQPKSVRGTPAGKFGQHLEQLMVSAGLTTTEFAERIGVTPDTVRKYLRGAAVPVIDKWPKIGRTLGLKNAKDIIPDLPLD